MACLRKLTPLRATTASAQTSTAKRRLTKFRALAAPIVDEALETTGGPCEKEKNGRCVGWAGIWAGRLRPQLDVRLVSRCCEGTCP